MEAFSQRDIPYFYEFVDRFPYYLPEKEDFRALEK